jgi:hypothetical protein
MLPSKSTPANESSDGTVNSADFETEFGSNLASEPAGWTLKPGLAPQHRIAGQPEDIADVLALAPSHRRHHAFEGGRAR